MRKTALYVLPVLWAFLSAGCEKEAEDPLDPGAVIDGDPFRPAVVTITRDSTSLAIRMISGDRSLDFITSDTITGRYLIDTTRFKSSVVYYRAQLVYNDRNHLYDGVSGTLELIHDSDVYSGTFESVVQSPQRGRVVIREGVFNDIEAGIAP